MRHDSALISVLLGVYIKKTANLDKDYDFTILSPGAGSRYRAGARQGAAPRADTVVFGRGAPV